MKWKEGCQFENPPSGSHIARCIGVVDLGTQPKVWQGETKLKRLVRLSFELPLCPLEGKYKPELKGKPFAVSRPFTQSLRSTGNLRPFLESWRGRKFTKEEIAVYDPRKLVGVPCRLTLVENGDFVNIDGVSKLSPAETEACPKQVNQGIYFSLEKDEFDTATFSRLTESTQEKIKASPEYAALFRDETESEPDPDPAVPNGTDDAEEMDSVPF